ncbi:MAG: sulfatase-like hydrolase/transferase [Bacteroidetes bacterium]|nr:sulfatase-like hydrolase/transferase [Bacteroidota bacterium]
MIVNLVENTLQRMAPSDSPKFFFVDFNCRKDPTTSDCVREVFKQFKAHGYDDSNSIMVLCSDHGYPDPGKDEGHPGYYRKKNLGHDLLLTDDNIMIPMSMRYPGCPKGKKVETTIGTIDMMPTVMDILGLDPSSYCDAHGASLLPLINGHPDAASDMAGRFQRSDSRFSMQTGKATSIRNGQFKYIYYHDDIRGKGNEEFFDVINDPEEMVNLVSSNKVSIQQRVSLFRTMYNRSEEAAFEFQLKYLLSRFEPEYEDVVENSDKVLVLDSCNPIFADLIASICRKINPDIECVLLIVEHEDVEFLKFDKIISSGNKSWAEVAKGDVPLDLCSGSVDLVIVPYNTSEGRDNGSLKSFLRNLSPKQAVWLDYNMEVPVGHSQRYDRNYMVTRWAMIRADPLKGISSVIRKLTRVLASVFFKNGKSAN